MEEYKLIIPAQVKIQLKEAIGRFDTFISVLDLMVKNGVNVDDLRTKVSDFKLAGENLVNELDKLD